MTVVSAFLVPGSPLPQLHPEAQAWGAMANAIKKVGEQLRQSKPDAVLVYSSQWFAVLDQQWLTRRQSTGLHVDENWHEFGEMSYDIYADVELAYASVAGSSRTGVHARGINYDKFPIDSGTISACKLMQIGTADTPLVVGSNNLYHDPATTEKLAAMAVRAAKEQGKRIAVVGIGGLSGSQHRKEIDPNTDHIASSDEDKLNKEMLALLESGSIEKIKSTIGDYAKNAKVDMGFKHFHWIMGAINWNFKSATVHGYGPCYGSGAAAVEFHL